LIGLSGILCLLCDRSLPSNGFIGGVLAVQAYGSGLPRFRGGRF
jgi:hypothetical protein